MSNREGLAVLCVAAVLLLLGAALRADVLVVPGIFAAVLGLAILAWNLLAEDRSERRGD